MPLNTGQVLENRYRIVKPLGQGGFGAVYRAWDIRLAMPVAIKENLDASPQAQKQFGVEAKMLARLSHPNLARVSDYFFVPNQGQYLVMDFVDGENLDDLVQTKGSLPESQVITWIDQVCSALSYLHHQTPPIIHRDIKPANIIIRPDGQAVLVDFGIAKVYDPKLTTTMGAKAVTPGFSPPEQYGMGKTDVRSDIYALGATCYQLLTGQKLPESVNIVAGFDTITSPTAINNELSASVDRAILKCVQVNAENRFQSIEEFSGALRTPQIEKPTMVSVAGQSQLQPKTAKIGKQSKSIPFLEFIDNIPIVIRILILAGIGGFTNLVLFSFRNRTPFDWNQTSYLVLIWLVMSIFTLGLLIANLLGSRKSVFWRYQLDIFVLSLGFYIPNIIRIIR